MNTFTDIFEKILEDGHVDVLVTGQDADSLRTSLVRRWTKHKEDYDRLGFLTDERKNLSMSAAKIQIGEMQGTRFILKPRKQRATYQILSTDNTEQDNNG